MKRPGDRPYDEMRSVSIERNFTKYAAGSVLIGVGDTKVICTASISEDVPRFLRKSGQGWLTAEYGMLPGATSERVDREAARGKQSGRTIEIQRLIGRALRQNVDLNELDGLTVRIDCDVVQADGGTRTAAITGSSLAIYDALVKADRLSAFTGMVSAVSVGIVDGVPLLDLEYVEDSQADTDMNFVVRAGTGIVEIQGTAERNPFSTEDLNKLIGLAMKGTGELKTMQERALGIS